MSTRAKTWSMLTSARCSSSVVTSMKCAMSDRHLPGDLHGVGRDDRAVEVGPLEPGLLRPSTSVVLVVLDGCRHESVGRVADALAGRAVEDRAHRLASLLHVAHDPLAGHVRRRCRDELGKELLPRLLIHAQAIEVIADLLPHLDALPPPGERGLGLLDAVVHRGGVRSEEHTPELQ